MIYVKKRWHHMMYIWTVIFQEFLEKMLLRLYSKRNSLIPRHFIFLLLYLIPVRWFILIKIIAAIPALAGMVIIHA